MRTSKTKITISLVEGMFPRKSTIMGICKKALKERYIISDERSMTGGEHSFCVTLREE